MTEAAGNQKNTAYGVFVQACWAQHKRQYPDELIHKEIEEFNKQCSVWWYNLSEQERDRFQEMADRSNAQQAVNQYGGNNIVTTVQGGVQQQMIVTNTAGGSTIPSFGSSFSGNTDGTYYIQGGQQGQVLNAVVDNTGQVLNYSTNASGQTIVRQVGGQVQQVQVQQQKVVTGNSKVNSKPIKDPNAPKKPLSAYFLFSQEERLKVKAENPDYSITEVAKELGKRWATLQPDIKNSYEQRYQDARRVYESEMNNYKPKKKKDPNAPKQPLSAYFIFSTEERLKVKEENPGYSICEVAKELGRRWAEMDPQVKQRYQARAEEERQKYDNDMANYRQGNLANAAAAANQQQQQAVTTVVAAAADNHASSPAVTTAATYTAVTAVPGQDYSNLLQ
jgi:transposase-like protein